MLVRGCFQIIVVRPKAVSPKLKANTGKVIIGFVVTVSAYSLLLMAYSCFAVFCVVKNYTKAHFVRNFCP